MRLSIRPHRATGRRSALFVPVQISSPWKPCYDELSYWYDALEEGKFYGGYYTIPEQAGTIGEVSEQAIIGRSNY